MDVFEILSSLFMLLCSVFGIICAVIFISVLIFDRQCRSITTLLVFNSVIAGFIVNIVYTCQSVYQLISDINDKLCAFRGFLVNSTSGLQYHTFCVQALHCLFATMPERQRRYFRSKRVVKFIVFLQWLLSFTFALPILLDGRIHFQPGSRICQVSFNDVYACLYLGTWIYFLPLPIIIGIYIRILVYIKQNSFPTIIRQNIFERQRQRHELRIYRRSIIPVIVLFIMGFPYIVFLVIHFSHLPTPPYAARVCFMFISLGQGISMLLCLINTDDIRKCLINGMRKMKRRRRQRRVQCISVISQAIQMAPVQMM